MSEPDATTTAYTDLLAHAPSGTLPSTRFRRVVRLAWTDASGARTASIDAPSVLGSAPHVSISVADSTVSRLHLEVAPADDGVWIEDLGSRNGTFYENARVARLCVPDGARIRAGGTTVTVHLTRDATESPLYPEARFGALLGRSTVMRELFLAIARVAATDETVLVHGETGTGKELIARALHEHSSRRTGPFVVVDCGAMAENLLDAELFGYVRGAFTGADRDRRGAFLEADGGTLFLDEIGEIPLAVQPRLLRAIESRSVRRVGQSAYEKVDLRFVCATHRDLRAMVNAGTFREDLYFRVAVLGLEVPPVRKRAEDVPMLVAGFLPEGLREQAGEEAVAKELMARAWGGNVRELRNFAGRVKAFGWKSALSDGERERVAAEKVEMPSGLVSGGFSEARDRAMELWVRAYVKALSERCGGDKERMAAEAGVSASYLWKLGKR